MIIALIAAYKLGTRRGREECIVAEPRQKPKPTDRCARCNGMYVTHDKLLLGGLRCPSRRN